jgi:hypothetical protein
MNSLKVIAIGTVLMLVGCTDTVHVSESTKTDVLRDLAYVRDSRTGLCFAVLQTQGYGGFQSASITNIPCDKMPNEIKP